LIPGDIVWVPFPHVEDNRIQSRPALIVATGLAGSLNLCWALMITAAANPAWPEDVLIGDDEATGLRAPSRIRTGKIATLASENATPIGRLPETRWVEVCERLGAIMGESVAQ
jgi:mRNA-degrading endonuclease toxin of MazEF toxin-antitoxin module